jgi:nitric oxide reductase large subunit
MLLAVEAGLLLVFAAMAILVNTVDHTLIISGLDLAVILASLLGSLTALRNRQPHMKLAGLFLITMIAATAHLFWYSGAALVFLAIGAILAVADAVGNILLIILPRRYRRGD